MKLSVVIPTIQGREEYLKAALASFEKTVPPDTQFIIERDHATCGVAWNAGIKKAEGDYILLSADDIEPAALDWLDAGIYWSDKGYLPCARILHTDGTLQSCGDWTQEMDTGTLCEFARIPFGSKHQVKAIYPIIPIHYATDYWFSYRGRLLGWETLVVREFCFYHHYASVGRMDERLMDDMQIFWKVSGLS